MRHTSAGWSHIRIPEMVFAVPRRPGQKPWPTAVSEAIFTAHLAKWAEMFLRKNASYGESDYHALGIKGYVPEIRRKFARLVRAWWNEESTEDWTEQPEEIILDLIGTLFMAYDCLAQESPATSSPEDPDEPGDGGWSALPDQMKAVLQDINKRMQTPGSVPVTLPQAEVLSNYYYDHGERL